jgi:sugar/nucleoside kinase (ribokinase family)
MIVVLGRPALEPVAPTQGVSEATGGADTPEGRVLSAPLLAGPIAIAAASVGASVELTGSIGDDPEGDLVVVQLGRAGVGHAALLRDPGGRTRVARGVASEDRPLPRLDAEDIRLGLGYLMDYRVLVLAEPLAPDAEAAALDAALYHGAVIIAVVPPDVPVSEPLGAAATIIEAPVEPGPRFAELVGRFAASVDGGAEPGPAFEQALRSSGWERSSA